MAFLGLINVPPVEITYQTFQQLATGSGFGASTLRAGATAASLGIRAAAGWVVGAGTAGFFVGQKILESLEPTLPPLTIRQLYKVPPGEGNIRVLATVTLQGVGQLDFDNVFPSPVVVPVALPASGGTFRYGAFVGPNAEFVGYFQAAPEQQLSPFRVTSVNRVDGQPSALQKIPAPAFPIVPYQPIKFPTTVPTVPGEPDLPITPTIIPAPENDPEEDNKVGSPGVIVQIPEVGIQLRFTPTGVTVGSYKGPNTVPYEIPKVPPPPNTPVPASDVCPCPEDGDSLDEVICRVKTVQEKLLDDGYDTDTRTAGPSNYLSLQGLEEEFYLLKIAVASKPANVKTQSYQGGAPTVYWVGWLSWRFTDRQGERIFLQFDEMEFSPPPGCTGYVIAANSGCTLNAQAYTRTKRPYIDNC